MPAMPSVTTASTSSAAAFATTHVPRHPFKTSQLFAPAGVAALSAYRHKGFVVDGSKKLLGLRKPLASSSAVISGCNFSNLPELSISSNSHWQQQLHASSTDGQLFSHHSASCISDLGDLGVLFNGIPSLGKSRRYIKPTRAYKNETFGFRYPVIAEKPEWWWRTLATVPYLIALQISDTGYFIQPFLEHYEFLGELIYFVPGAITRLPPWFTMLYCYLSYICIVKNKEWPHFFRYHLMMGMLLETGLQVIWYTSNFFPLIHYNGVLGMHYWAGVGLAFIVILLQCVRCALAGGYANIPFISDAAYIHTLFNIGGFQRPF